EPRDNAGARAEPCGAGSPAGFLVCVLRSVAGGREGDVPAFRVWPHAGRGEGRKRKSGGTAGEIALQGATGNRRAFPDSARDAPEGDSESDQPAPGRPRAGDGIAQIDHARASGSEAESTADRGARDWRTREAGSRERQTGTDQEQ